MPRKITSSGHPHSSIAVSYIPEAAIGLPPVASMTLNTHEGGLDPFRATANRSVLECFRRSDYPSLETNGVGLCAIVVLWHMKTHVSAYQYRRRGVEKYPEVVPLYRHLTQDIMKSGPAVWPRVDGAHVLHTDCCLTCQMWEPRQGVWQWSSGNSVAKRETDSRTPVAIMLAIVLSSLQSSLFSPHPRLCIERSDLRSWTVLHTFGASDSYVNLVWLLAYMGRTKADGAPAASHSARVLMATKPSPTRMAEVRALSPRDINWRVVGVLPRYDLTTPPVEKATKSRLGGIRVRVQIRAPRR